MNAEDVAHIEHRITRARAEGREFAATITERSAQLAEQRGMTEVAEAHRRLAQVLRQFSI